MTDSDLLGTEPSKTTLLYAHWWSEFEAWCAAASAVRSRTPAAPSADGTPAFRCTDCGQPLQGDAAACPACGSGNRTITVSDTVAAHESIALKGRPSGAGKGKWFVSISAGDSYTRDLGAWINRELAMDKQHNCYRELLVLHDGTRIESVAQLTDHKECPD